MQPKVVINVKVVMLYWTILYKRCLEVIFTKSSKRGLACDLFTYVNTLLCYQSLLKCRV